MPRKRTTDEFISYAKNVHGDKYDYSITVYVGCHDPITIICPTHGKFSQLAYAHVSGKGCTKCGYEKISNQYKHSITDFKSKAILVHDNKYDYSRVNYINSKTKVCIICPDHGEFCQIPANHLRGSKCPKCYSSKGESKVRSLLNDINIEFIEQYHFSECKGKTRRLPFDFYLPELNTCIEYDGIQHFEPRKYLGGIEGYKRLQTTDKIKSEYCESHGIRLVRIRYDESIEDKLSGIFS